ncbi:MAG: MFS transporter [Bacteroidetes bacterium]|jgi:PAT family beta-lactamase induction signal transducer AmpG|nr:MFS transporter [Bacteroidota bacterium]
MTNAEKKSSRHPFYWIPTTWFAMGLPNLVLGGTVASLLYKSLGYSDGQIAFWTGIIVLPWSFKPLWGPFMELYKTKKFYIQVSQIACGVLFALSVLSLYTATFFPLSVTLFFLIAFFGATQDMAADGIYLSELSASDQARYVGWQGTFYNVAKLFSNGGMVFLAGILIPVIGDRDAWAVVLAIYAIIMLALGMYNRGVLPDSTTARSVTSTREVWITLKDVMVSFFRKKHIWAGILFIVLYRFAEGQGIKIMPLFLKATRAAGGLGLSEATVGLLTGIYGTAAFVLGSLAAGYFVSNKGLTRTTLLLLCAFFNLPFAAYAYLAITQASSVWVIGTAIAVEHFGYGFGFIGIILFIMQRIAPGPYQMAHYAFGSAITYFGYTIASMMSGAISDYLGYAHFFIWVLVSTIPAFLVSWLVPLSDKSNNPET